MKRTVPVIGLAGYSGAGKTTFLEKLIAELKHRGYRIGVIKHTHHRVKIDQPGKDTWRHSLAGAEVVALASPDGVFLVKKFESDPGPEKVIEMIDGVDLIIVEGYKRGNWPKIVVSRHGITTRPEIPVGEIFAEVSDAPSTAGVPHFGSNDAAGIADLIELYLVKPLPPTLY